ncbi:MAG: hypothetical protein K0U93_01795 [Gammaproteobacteria bacterium]|nr:hypothetical protein [Gammaproteobacteria bacterium]
MLIGKAAKRGHQSETRVSHLLGAVLALSLTLVAGCSDEEMENTKEAAKKAADATKEAAKEAAKVTKEVSQRVAKQAVEKGKEAYENAKEGMDGTKLVPLCCYNGDYAMAYFDDVRLIGSDAEMTISEALPGLQARQGLAGVDLPVESFTIGRVIDRTAEETMKKYDANDDGQLDEPEAVVLYLVELARAMGKDVSGISKDGVPVKALRLTVAERSGLAQYAKANLKSMSEDAKRVFEAIEEIRIE